MLFAVQFLAVVLLADCASPAIVERDILLNEAERLGIALSEDELRTQSSVSEEVLSALGEDGAVLRENFRKDLLAEKMRHRMRCAIAERIPQISRIALQLQKPREVLSNEQTEMSLVERMIDAAYEKWLKSKASAPSRTTAERSNR